MKRFLALLTALLTLICATATALERPQLIGCWTSDTECLDLHEDGTMEIYRATDGRFALDSAVAFVDVINGDDVSLSLFGDGKDYVQRFASREGWMDLTDANDTTTSWFNSTPDEPSNSGLAKNAELPLVGVWTQMSDDVTCAALEIYDDGYYGLTDLIEVGSAGELGLYRLENGLLTLFPTELESREGGVSGDTLTLGGVSYARAEALPFVPTAEQLCACTWRNESVSYTFKADGSIEGMAIADARYTRNGGRLIIGSESTGWTTRLFATLDGDALVLTGTDANGQPTQTRLTPAP